jgi:bacteriocin biosynthesis cyclodehydratase domain-containing protein
MIVLTAGTFGQAVAQRIQAERPIATMALPSDEADLAPIVERHDFIALALWRPYVSTCRTLDDLCFRAGCRWSMAEVSDTRLSCGPLMWPGQGPCYHCYHKRWSSHHPAPDRELALSHAYANDPTLGPAGFIPPMVEIAAAALMQDAEAPPAAAGRLRVVDILTAAVLETEVIGVHRCPRCRPARDDVPGQRFTDRLAPALEALLG